MFSSLSLLLLLLLSTTLSQCKPLNNPDHTKLNLDRTKRNVQYFQLPATQLTLPSFGRPEIVYPTQFQPQGQPQAQPGSADYLNQYFMYAVIKGYGEEIGRRMALGQNVEKLKGSTVESFQ